VGLELPVRVTSALLPSYGKPPVPGTSAIERLHSPDWRDSQSAVSVEALAAARLEKTLGGCVRDYPYGTIVQLLPQCGNEEEGVIFTATTAPNCAVDRAVRAHRLVNCRPDRPRFA